MCALTLHICVVVAFPTLVLGDKHRSSVNAARTPPNCCTISWTWYLLHCQRRCPMFWVFLVKRNRNTFSICLYFLIHPHVSKFSCHGCKLPRCLPHHARLHLLNSEPKSALHPLSCFLSGNCSRNGSHN